MGEGSSSSPIAAGDFLAGGRYRVDSVLGEGGMGVVCAATHVALGQKVAIKFLLPEALEHPQAVARFEREARASASMTSEHVVRVTDVGTLETGAPYFVMEFLEGEDLAQRLRRVGPLDPRAAVALMIQACEGLVEAHSKGLVHRDIKPSNLFLAKRASGKSVLKVIDFGIAKAETSRESGGHELTRTSEIMGSPQYMSPEQLRDTKNVDARTDIWSLGASFLECLTGVPPFTGETMTDLVVKIAIEPPRDPLTVRPDLPTGLVTLLLRCLAKKPSDRFESAEDVLHALEALRGSLSSMAVSFTDTGSPTRASEQSGNFLAFDATSVPISATQPGLATVASTAREIVAKKRSKILAIGVGVAALVALGAVGWGLAGRGSSSRGETAEATSASPSTPVPAPTPAHVEPEPHTATVAAPEPRPAPVEPTVAPAPAPAKPAVVKGAPSKSVAAAATPAATPVPAPPPPPKEGEKKRRYDPGFE
jgi:serine/threonine-protein kinase